MDFQHIIRIEQLRYELSKCTRAALCAKGSERTQLEQSAANLKKELEHLLSLCPNYVLIRKAYIDALHAAFLALSRDEREHAIAGIGAGAKILDEMEKILSQNAQKREAIAKLICALDNFIGEKKQIAAVLEGSEQFCVSEIAAPRDAIDIFISAARELEFYCSYFEGKIFLSNFPSFAFSTSSIFNTPLDQPQHFELAVLKEINGKKILISAALAAAAQRAEEKMQKILAHPKVKRWILGIFKDEGEKEKYAKVQRIFAQLASARKRQKEVKAGAIFTSNIGNILIAPIEVSSEWKIRSAFGDIQAQAQVEVQTKFKQISPSANFYKRKCSSSNLQFLVL